MTSPWWFVLSTGFIPLLALIYPDFRKSITDWYKAKKILSDNLDPILKTADELYGKIYDLAKSDFKQVYKTDLTTISSDTTERIYILYLFSCFFGRIAILRQKNNFSVLAKTKQGRRFTKFLMSFESKTNIRITTRANQRLIGDAMIKQDQGSIQLLTLFEFRNGLLKDSSLKEVILPLDTLLYNSYDKRNRQKILYFGLMIKVLMDYFDGKNRITKPRFKGFENKLSVSTKNQFIYKTLKLYLPFIQDRLRYIKK